MVNRVPFWKMQGSGNDFILIDHRRPLMAEADCPGFVKRVCAPKFGVGADGLIFIEPSAHVDFRWRFFNADGSEAEMCGNGGRCAARFAFLNGIAQEKMAFETLAGVIHAQVLGRRVKLELSQPHSLQLNLEIPLPGQSWTGPFYQYRRASCGAARRRSRHRAGGRSRTGRPVSSLVSADGDERQFYSDHRSPGTPGANLRTRGRGRNSGLRHRFRGRSPDRLPLAGYGLPCCRPPELRGDFNYIF